MTFYIVVNQLIHKIKQYQVYMSKIWIFAIRIFIMDDYNQVDKNNLLYHRHQYLGEFTPQNLVFNANLQEFSQSVCYIFDLLSREKLSSRECYEEIELLWQQLTQSYKALEIEKNAIE
ncbi:hypothetical protein [Nostoc sp. NMS1]|uniref:DUF7219 family protein n=2 Tax=unclassified Nostoc TaxID=2593658 RepID=UPI0034545425